MTKRYAAWGSDKSYRWLWQAALFAGWRAFKERYTLGARLAAYENSDYDRGFQRNQNNEGDLVDNS